LLAVGEGGRDLSAVDGLRHHVVVGDDVALGVEHEAGAGAALAAAALGLDGDRARQRLGGDGRDRAGVALDVAPAGRRGDGGGAAVVVVLGQRVAQPAAQAAREQRGSRDRGEQPAATALLLGLRGLVRGAPAAASLAVAGAAVAVRAEGATGSAGALRRGAGRRGRRPGGVGGGRRAVGTAVSGAGRARGAVGGGRVLRGGPVRAVVRSGRRDGGRGRRRVAARVGCRALLRCRSSGGMRPRGRCGRRRGERGALVLGAHSFSPRSTALFLGRTRTRSFTRRPSRRNAVGQVLFVRRQLFPRAVRARSAVPVGPGSFFI